MKGESAMKASEVYLRAAELQDRHPGPSCFSINQIASGKRDETTKEAIAYHALFCPNLALDRPNLAWGVMWADYDEWIGAKQSCRVLALLFMACIARDSERGEGKP